MVFYPPKATYSLEESNKSQTIWLLDDAGNKIEPLKSNARLEKIRTRRGHNIATLHISYPGASTTLLFSHGNATDIGGMAPQLVDFSQRLKVNILIYDYSGYGLSEGKSSPSNVYNDAEAVYSHLIHNLRCTPQSIVLYGQSLGSGPTIYLGSKYPVAGVIIHSGIMSGLRVIRQLDYTKWYDIFPNVDLVKRVRAPTFIIHGTEDVEVPIRHGLGLSDAAANPYQPWFVEGAGHNNIELSWRRQYYEKVGEFLHSIGRGEKPVRASRTNSALDKPSEQKDRGNSSSSSGSDLGDSSRTVLLQQGPPPVRPLSGNRL